MGGYQKFNNVDDVMKSYRFIGLVGSKKKKKGKTVFICVPFVCIECSVIPICTRRRYLWRNNNNNKGKCIEAGSGSEFSFIEKTLYILHNIHPSTLTEARAKLPVFNLLYIDNEIAL